MMVKSEGVANCYTQYIHFIYPLDTMDGNCVRKMLSLSQNVTLHPRDRFFVLFCD